MKPTDDLKLPKDFWFGAAASAPQTEGASDVDGKSPSTWDMWHRLEPERFDLEMGPNQTSDVYHHYRDDVKRMQAMKLNSYRTSIAWTRLLPDGKTLNPKAVAFYRDYFKTMRDGGIEPVINLFHFDMPWWLMEKGGWEYEGVSDAFAYYASVCVETFGDLVTYWTTFNEPIVHVECSYLYGYHYPAIHDFKKAIYAGYQTILAHAKAIEAMRTVNPKLKLGTILNLTPVYGKSDQIADVKAREAADLLNTKSFLDGMVLGTFSEPLLDLLREQDLMPDTNAEDLKIISNVSLDFIGVNYYQPRRVKAPTTSKTPAQDPEDLYIPYLWPDRKMNPYRGWEIYPESLSDIATLIKDSYHNIPWYLSENGMGVADEMRFVDENGTIQDDYRIEFIYDHLKVLEQAIADGANCFGYHLWTFVDCWSWLNGYRNRYGFYRIDLKTQKRYAKQSSYWMRDLISYHQKGE
ncbi:glycoside hydrolase family 1 protein [Erysipelothrix rhusiopathiae]|nr:glycoside hydrolase family 1 protein [Erysipelothrix rhusiopathiae]MDE8124873.1 glycoside hydrolase family 1 protein [Erysipelothrix rhusiopathiae]MDE8144028.1 glycoside hydrolase family 1 protein [Erysipelothrix rhusiopathiae]MDE9421000.1 glycoside hydrolase family 1 protein [Erysipelothrix rhusiopathiae]